MTGQDSLKESSPAVHAHLGIIQSVIQRMASNSSSSKAWCITLVSAVLVIVADKGKPNYAWIAVIPTTLFLVLDAYYLALEKGFRDGYNVFIDKLHGGAIQPSDLYAVAPSGPLFRQFLRSLVSFAVWPFYLTLLVMIYLAKVLVL
jgi:hypothetical protein